MILQQENKIYSGKYQSVMAVPYDMPIVGYGNHRKHT